MIQTIISVINLSARVLDPEVEQMVHAIGVQLARDVAPVWGATIAIEFVPKGGTPNGIHCEISDTPDQPGAAGYHDEGADGVPYIKVFTFDGAPALLGSQAVSVTLSHEILEVVGDAPANKWVDGPNGDDYAFELCDAVEGDTYEIDGVSVSNFVYPAFFDPKATIVSKLAHLDTVAFPFGMSAGGYQIRRTEPGNIDQVFARIEPSGVHMLGNGVHVVFGPKFPSAKREAKIAKAKRRRSA